MADTELTTLSKLIDPEVIGDMIQAKVEKAITVLPYATLDRTLSGRSGSTITVARFVWDGEAEEVAEGDEIPIRALGSESTEYKVKKAGIGTEITDEAVLSAHGNPVGQATTSMANSIQAKLDEDAHVELLKSKQVYNANDAVSYNNVVDSIGLFQAEGAIDMVMLVNPDIVTTLRKDANFIDRNKYGNQVMMNGEIGMIGNARIVPSRRVSGVGGYFYSPIILTNDPMHNDDVPALTYFIKRDTNIEVDRKPRKRSTEITGDQIYVVALTNESKVVILKTTGANLNFARMQEPSYSYPGLSVALDTTPITGKIELTRTNATTWAATLKLSGKANVISATQKTELGFDASTTHYITGRMEIPGAPISEEAPVATMNGNAIPAREMKKVGAAWYYDFVFGLKDGGDGTPVFASGGTSYTLVANGVTTTVTPDISGIELA